MRMQKISNPGNNERRIGIMGGTFDPIHFGHLIIAEESRYRFQLERVLFIPAGNPPHKPDEPISNREDRFRMTELAIEGNPGFEMSDIEFKREGPSFTVDTLRELKTIYGEEASLFFITGADSILDIPKWYKPDEIVRLCTLIAAVRPGYDLKDVEQKLPKNYLTNIEFLETPEIDISSTEIRRRVATGEPIKYLLPLAVENYIFSKGLYKAVK